MSDHQLACLKIHQFRFCPTAIVQSAIVALESPAAALQDVDFAETVATLRLNEFCLRFFSMPVYERKTEYAELETSVRPYPQLAWRLKQLKSGLSVSVPVSNQHSPELTQAQDTCDIFVMTPSAAASSLRRSCSDMTTQTQKVKDSKNTLLRFKAAYPDHAALQAPGVMPLTDRLTRAIAKPKRPAREASSQGASNNSGAGSYAWLIMVVVIGVVRFIGAQSRIDDSSRYVSTSVPSYNAPNHERIKQQISELLKKSSQPQSDISTDPGQFFRSLQERRQLAGKRSEAEDQNSKGANSDSDNSTSEIHFEGFSTSNRNPNSVFNSFAENPATKKNRNSDSPSMTTNGFALPSGGELNANAPNAKLDTPELMAVWINYVQNGADMTPDERERVEQTLRDNGMDPRSAAIPRP